MTSYFAAALAALVLLFIGSVVKTFFEDRAFQKLHGCKPVVKVPQSERIIGYGFYKASALAHKEHRLLWAVKKRFEDIGRTFSITILGQAITATIEPENVKTILATNFKDYGLGKRLDAFGPLLGRGIFTTDGAHWEHSRALVRPNFARAQVAELETFEPHIQNMLEKIPGDGSTVDLQTLFFQLTFDSATEFLFGESVNILQSPDGSEQVLFAKSFDFAQSILSNRARLGPFMWLHHNKEFDLACQRVHKFVDRFVYKALEYRKMAEKEKFGAEEKYVFLHELAKATDDPKQLRDELLNILLAGRDTTASLLSNTFHVLARRPDIWERLQAEVATLNGEIPDYEMLRGMKYVKNILNESLRTHPVVPGNARFANKNTVLPVGGGPDGLSPVFIKKGATVSYSVFSMHRRKDVYGPDADEFKPERWEANLRPGWAYLPFNGGPRICVGQQFALTEASYTLVRICQMFKGIECREFAADGSPSPWIEGLQLTLATGNGVKVAMIPR